MPLNLMQPNRILCLGDWQISIGRGEHEQGTGGTESATDNATVADPTTVGILNVDQLFSHNREPLLPGISAALQHRFVDVVERQILLATKLVESWEEFQHLEISSPMLSKLQVQQETDFLSACASWTKGQTDERDHVPDSWQDYSTPCVMPDAALPPASI